MQTEIELAVCKQEALGIDVLVHGEARRHDRVEYFGEQLDGFAFTANGRVQSYGLRCVKPPIIYGDVARHPRRLAAAPPGLEALPAARYAGLSHQRERRA